MQKMEKAAQNCGGERYQKKIWKMAQRCITCIPKWQEHNNQNYCKFGKWPNGASRVYLSGKNITTKTTAMIPGSTQVVLNDNISK